MTRYPDQGVSRVGCFSGTGEGCDRARRGRASKSDGT